MNVDMVIMYLRKSREDLEREKQTREDTLQAHRERLSEFLLSRDLKWIERSEVKTGDTIAGRPMFQKVLKEDIPSGKYHAICVTEISRLGRGDMEDAGRIYKTIIRYNIKIITPHKEYDPENPSDLRQIRFELFLSREEYEMIRERLYQAREQRAKKGYAANYIVTLGYEQNRGKVIEIPEESALVREIFEMRAENMSYYEIAEVLNSRGLLTKRGTKWHHTTIRKILHNQRYIGKAKWRGQYYESQAPVLVSIELWNKVHQEIQPVRSVQRRFPRQDSPYLVELYCGECGRRMYGEWVVVHKHLVSGRRKNYNDYGIYNCIGRKHIPKCQHQERIDHIHEAVFSELWELVTNPVTKDMLIKERSQKVLNNTDNYKIFIAQKEQDIKKKEKFLLKCKTDYKQGELAAVLYSEFYEDTTKEIDILKKEIEQLKNKVRKSTIKIEDPESIFYKLQEYLTTWSELPNKTKKLIIASFLTKVEVTRNGRLYYNTILPLTLSI